MRRAFQVASWAGMIVVALILSGCGPGEESAQGFKTPVEALDAYGKAMEKGDEATFRKVAAKFDTGIEGLDAIISLQTDMEPAEAAKINLIELASIQGFGDVASKRFETEIDGDKAVIVQVFEDSGAFNMGDKFRKWIFEKSGDQWYLVDSEFGDAKDLPEKYEWDKNIADVSDAMRDFVSGFDGTAEAVEAALAKYAEGVDTNMGFFTLEEPVISAKEMKDGQECYTLRVKSGSILRTYTICWQGDKIVSIEEVEE